MIKIKALSIKQPFPTFILLKLKDRELRTKNTNFRGFFLIHAAKVPDVKFMKEYGFSKERFVNGCILGVAELIGSEKYSEERFGYNLDNVFRFEEPIDYKGKLGFFEVTLTDPIMAQLRKCLPLVHWIKIDDLKSQITITEENKSE